MSEHELRISELEFVLREAINDLAEMTEDEKVADDAARAEVDAIRQRQHAVLDELLRLASNQDRDPASESSTLDSAIDIEGAERGWTGAP